MTKVIVEFRRREPDVLHGASQGDESASLQGQRDGEELSVTGATEAADPVRLETGVLRVSLQKGEVLVQEASVPG